MVAEALAWPEQPDRSDRRALMVEHWHRHGDYAIEMLLLGERIAARVSMPRSTVELVAIGYDACGEPLEVNLP
jgi:hypothetical protein